MKDTQNNTKLDGAFLNYRLRVAVPVVEELRVIGKRKHRNLAQTMLVAFEEYISHHHEEKEPV